MSFKEYYNGDLKRYNGASYYMRMFHYFFRKSQFANGKISQKVYRVLFSFIKKKHFLEIYWDAKIGKGLYLGHPYGITINPNAIIGENVNLHKGVTIGQENRGKRQGVPVIGNEVWIGINSTIVGNIKIGNDVLIAPNSFVNCDIPDHSIVFGNPCIIKHKENATSGYINHQV